jgi:tetratricopeptide (TPR) repeat protein
MSRSRIQTIFIALVSLIASACGGQWSGSNADSLVVPAAVEIPSTEESDRTAVRYLEDKVKANPDDFIAYNKLTGYYLQYLRETGNVEYLDLALRAAQASIKIIPLDRNKGALYGLAQVEFASHDFRSALRYAEQLIKMESDRSYPYVLLADALIELGEYDKATVAVKKVEEIDGASVASKTRIARLAFLNGKIDSALEQFSKAVLLAEQEASPNRETVAWCRWQLGEMAFAKGDYLLAERSYQSALAVFPDYYRALGSLAKALAAKGELEGSIEYYRRAVERLPDPVFLSALGDVYKVMGRDKEASAQYELVEQIARLSGQGGAIYSRQLALFYADHDLRAEEAYAQAVKEYESRRDIYGADAMAWTALKAGKVAEARAAIEEALKLGTRDARLFYHAGMIFHAAGDKSSASDYLTRALKLSPQFDPLQSRVARQTLEGM